MSYLVETFPLILGKRMLNWLHWDGVAYVTEAKYTDTEIIREGKNGRKSKLQNILKKERVEKTLSWPVSCNTWQRESKAKSKATMAQ